VLSRLKTLSRKSSAMRLRMKLIAKEVSAKSLAQRS
jgi:hypothetical protein